MDDRTLLELAAKAAGNEIWTDIDGNIYTGFPERRWNPLEDDGDALRLAVKLNLLIMPYPYDKAVRVTQIDQVDTIEYWGEDAFAATRRAIVRAAASIGKEGE